MPPSRAPWSALRGLSAGWVVAIWIVTKVVLYGSWLAATHHVQGDVWYYARELDLLRYLGPRDVLVEYPLPCIVLLSIPRLLSFGYPTVYTYVFVGFMLALDAAFTAWLWNDGRRRTGRPDALPALWWTVFTFALGTIGAMRFDLVPAILAGGALLLLRDRRPGLAGVCIALGACIKLWPALLIVTLLGRRENRVRATAGFLVTGVLIALACLWWAGWDRLISPLGWQRDRGLQIESIWATVPMVHRALGAPFEVYISAYQAFEVFGASPVWLSAASICTYVGGLAILALAAVWLFSPGARDLGGAGLLMLFITSVMIVTNKTFSPQYLMWFGGPLGAMLCLPERDTKLRSLPWLRPLVIGSVVLCALTQLIYPIGYGVLVERTPLTGLVTVLLAIRNVGVVGFVVVTGLCLVRLARRPAVAPPEVPMSIEES